MRLYITEAEARALAQGTVPAAVAEKCATKLATPAPPLPGQTDILTALAESTVAELTPERKDHDGNDRTAEPQA